MTSPLFHVLFVMSDPARFQDLGYIDPTNVSHQKFSPKSLQPQSPNPSPSPSQRHASCPRSLDWRRKRLCFTVLIHVTNSVLPCFLGLGQLGKMHA